MKEFKKLALEAKKEFEYAKDMFHDRVIDADQFLAEKEKYYETLEKLILGDDNASE